MKLVFYYPCKFTHAHATIHGPMGLSYIAAHLHASLGIPVEDIKIEVDPYRVLYHKPDMVGISAYTETYPQALEGAKLFKKELGNIPILLGGPHMNAMPESFLKDGPFDVGITGEGEHNTVELVEKYLKGQWGHTAFEGIPGSVYHTPDTQETPIITPKASKLEKLDELLYPRRELLEAWFPTDRKVGQWRQGLYTSRDCPFRCRFCIHSTIQGMPRYHSVERVITELNHILKYYPDQKFVTIYDDIFVVSKRRLKELVTAIRSEGIHKKLGFVAMVKPSTFNDEICSLLIDMNVRMVSFGFETGSSKVLKYLKGRGARLSQHQESIEICRKYNMRCTGYFIMGSPIETDEDLAKTYWFIQKNVEDLHSAGLFSLTPYPGTKFWNDYIGYKGCTPADEGWDVFDHKYLDWGTTYPFFINQHYDEAFLHKAFSTFKRFRHRLPSDAHLEREDLKVQSYKKALYTQLGPQIKGKRIFEISHFPNSYCEYTHFEESQVELYRLNYPKEAWPQSLNAEVLFLNHCLEQLPNPDTLLKKIKPLIGECKIYLAFYNALYLPVLLQLLKGDTPYLFEPEFLMKQYRLFSLPSMLTLLEQSGFQIKTILKVPQPLAQKQEESQLAQGILEPLANPQLMQDQHIYSYVLELTAHP